MKVIRKNKTFEAWEVSLEKPRPDWIQERLDAGTLIFPWDWKNPKNFSTRPTDAFSKSVVPQAAYGYGKEVAYSGNIIVLKGKKIQVFTRRQLFLKGYQITEE